MNKKKIIQVIIKIILFCFIGIIGLSILSTILLPEWTNSNEISFILRGFYTQPKDSMEAIFVGNSNVYRGISPMIIWEKQGYSSYNLSTPVQKMWISYYLIKEMYHYQSPKILFLDVDEVFSDRMDSEQGMRKAFDNMKLGSAKLEAIADPNFHLSLFDQLSYIFPALRYHSRWDSLSENDFKRIRQYYSCDYKGYLAGRLVKPSDKKEKKQNYMKKKQNEKENATQIAPLSQQYLEKIIQLCKEKNTKLVLMELPSLQTWSYEKSEAISQFASQHDLPFIDFNKTEHIAIDWDQDTEDGGFHLNQYGAKKVSNYLANFLSNQNLLTDHRQDSAYQDWHRVLDNYHVEFPQD